MDLRKKLKNFFIPSLQNELRPYSLRYGTLIFIIALSVSIELAFYAYVNVAFRQNELLGNIISSIQSTVADVLPEVIIEQTNAERLKNGEKALTTNSELVLAAKMKADDMAAKGYFSHQGPDGTMAWDWMKKANYNFSFAGENLAVNFFDANDVVNAWMNSPSHRENILNTDFTDIGIAAVRGTYEGHETVFVVQMFGTPGAPEPVYENYAIAPPVNPVVAKVVPSKNIPPAKTSVTSKTKVVAIATSSAPATLASSYATGTAGVVGKAVPKQNISFTQRLMVSPRHVARDAFIILLVYMLLSLLVPMYMIYHKHASSDRGLRFREIFMLFKQPIISALVTLACVSVVMTLNYLWSASGTNVFKASFGEGVSKKI